MELEEALQGGLTCRIVKDGKTVFSDTASGIAPLLHLLKGEYRVQGGIAYDKIVGKAAAFLYVLAGVGKVYAQVMSAEGRNVLEAGGIACNYHTLAERIINRRGDGLCPMEEAVEGINDASMAYAAIQKKYAELNRNR